MRVLNHGFHGWTRMVSREGEGEVGACWERGVWDGGRAGQSGVGEAWLWP